MRSPNQAAIKNECEKTIPALLKKFDLSCRVEIVRDENGWVNPCFFIGSQFVMRFNARDPSLPKFQREKLVYDLLQKSEVPVPKKVWLDESKEISRFDVLISELLPGAPIEPEWPNFSQVLRTTLAEQAGSMLARLHARQFDFFGELTERGPLPQSSSWISYLQSKLSYLLKDAQKLEIFNPEEQLRFSNVLNRYASFLTLKDSRLVHADFHFGNLIYSKSQIIGVLDFEWAFAGDPIYDLCRWMNPSQEDWPYSRTSFLKGYGRSEFSEHEKVRARIYQMIQNVELTIVSKLHFDKSEFESYKTTTLKQLNTL